ncbi:group II intron reverse transcriptase/maturase, partial [Virgibacillus dakarensis]|nr:group II intron reverse transcriptase/maturase [Virgibacillus dakarensis]
VLKLIRKWLRAGIMEDGHFRDSVTGVPQGGVISPLLSNIYLNVLDSLWNKKFAHLGQIVRYADDFVIMCSTKQQALESIQVLRGIMKKLNLTLSPEKSRLVNIWDNTDGFDFLGLHHRKFPILIKGGYKIHVMSHIPSKKAMKKMREKIKEYVGKNNKLSLDIEDLIIGLNRKLQGFKNYYLTSP